MNASRNVLILLLAIVAATASIVAWREYRVRDGTPVQEVRTFDADALRVARARIQELEGELAALRGRPASTAQSRDEAGPRPRVARPRNKAAPFGEIVNNPVVQQLLADRRKSQVDRQYAPLFKILDLPSAQLDQFKKLLAERQATMTDVIATDMPQGGDLQEVRQLVSASQAEVDGQIQAALGDAGYAQFQAFQQTLFFRNAVSGLANNMSGTPTPLSGDQSSQFADAVSTLAQTTFTPAQLQAMAVMDQQNQIRQQLGQLQQLAKQTQPIGNNVVALTPT